MKKILVLGSSGMLGHVVMARLEELGYCTIGISKSRKFRISSILLDVTSKEALDNFLDSHDFYAIINCAALLISQSEERKDLAVYLNSYMPHYLETKYMNAKTKIIHVSTDGIFSGRGAPYSEDSPHDSEHFYGKSKYLGEINNTKDITVRSAFWGMDLNKSSTSFFNWILKQNGAINGFVNHVFNGVSSLEFANFLDVALRNDLTGTYHLVAKSSVTKYDFLLLVKEVFSLKNEIIPVETPCVDRTLINNRSDVPYTEINYTEMLVACKKWIQKRHDLYSHYEGIWC